MEKAIGNIGLTVDGDVFSYDGPLSRGPPKPVKVFDD